MSRRSSGTYYVPEFPPDTANLLLNRLINVLEAQNKILTKIEKDLEDIKKTLSLINESLG